MTPTTYYSGVPLAQRIARWTSNPKVLGSIPRWDDFFFFSSFISSLLLRASLGKKKRKKIVFLIQIDYMKGI